MPEPRGPSTASAAHPAQAEPTMRLGLVMSTEVGMRTQYLNWRAALERDQARLRVDPVWAPITWWQPGGRVERLPLLPHAVKVRVRCHLEMQAGITAGPYDALLAAMPELFRGREGALRRQPYVFMTDATRWQLAEFGDLYPAHLAPLPAIDGWQHARDRVRWQGAAAVIAWSTWAAQGMLAEFQLDPRRVHVVPPGVQLDQWAYVPRERAPGTPAHLLFVGGDFYRKGGDLLLAWAEQTHAINWMLHLVTRDRVSTSHPNVRVYNDLEANSPALRALYRQADVFVLPTRADCYSIASIEAMASGLPVILTRTGGTGDIVRHGETGFLAEPWDTRRLAEHLEALIESPDACARMGAAARRDAETRFDVHRTVATVLRIIRQHVQGEP